MSAKKIILLDSNNIAYRAFYALPDTITTSSGIMTNAVFGFTSMLMKLIVEEKPDAIICAFDSKSPTFRHKKFEEYKVHRKKMPQELSDQFPLIKEVMSAFNIPCLERDGYEADDILASIANYASNNAEEIIIVSGDKDMLQLVSDNISVLAIKKGITDTIKYDREDVYEKFGVYPEQMQELLALMGDSSDNIPGIPGIGPKTAEKLIKEFRSIENIYKNLKSIKGDKLRDLLSDNEEAALASRNLIVLVKEIDLDKGIGEILDNNIAKLKIEKIIQVFDSLEFTGLKKRLPEISKIIGLNSSSDFKNRKEGNVEVQNLKLLTDASSFLKFLDKTGNKKIYLKKITIEIAEKTEGLLLFNGGHELLFLTGRRLEESEEKDLLEKILNDAGMEKIGFDFKGIFKFLNKNSVNLSGKIFDLKIAYLLLNPVKADITSYEIIEEYFDVEKDLNDCFESINIEFSDFSEINAKMKENKNNSQLSFESINTKITEDDGSPDSSRQVNLKEIKDISFYKKISDGIFKEISEEKMKELYWKIEAPLISILAEIEETGVNIDKPYLKQLIKEYDLRIKSLKKEIYDTCGKEFNLNSSQQLAEVLYGELKLPSTKKTKTGYSTDAETLKSICGYSPVINKLLDYREKTKLKNTYIDVIPKLIDPSDGRLHTTYNQLGTTTGRISSSNPNLQNIPIRTEFGRQIRKAFIPGKGYELLLSADYSQIELRVLAHLSEDENLIASFNKEEDIHTRTASEIFDISYSEVNEDLRRKAKAINFGIIYGMTEYGLKSRLSITEEEARDYIKKYFQRYPKINTYLDNLIKAAYKNGYSTTMFGRKRYIRELGSSNNRIRSLGERFALNTPIQGTAADIMKIATIRLNEEIKKKYIDCNIILHVHDELVLELKEKDMDEVKRIVKKAMEECVELKVKLKVDMKIGQNWYI